MLYSHSCFDMIVGSFDESDTKELIQESIRMYEFDHPNVLSMLGICLDAGPAPYIIMPYMANGSLLSYVKKDRKNLLVDSEEDDESVCDSHSYYTLLFN